MQIARHPPGISHILDGNQQPAARDTFAAPLTHRRASHRRVVHSVNLDIFGQGTIFANEGEFS
jgi:hypothetical protein